METTNAPDGPMKCFGGHVEFEVLRRMGSWHPIAAYITSGDGEDDRPNCRLILYLYFCRISIVLPQIIKAHERRVTPKWDAATVARLGRDYYIHYTRRDYGFMFSGDGFFTLYLGRQSNDSSSEQRWSCFLPWMQLRFIRHSLYGLNGEHIWTQFERYRRKGVDSFEEMRWHEKRCPKRSFEFIDFDGKVIEAITQIEEREWRHGTGWFKWLSLFRRSSVQRSLNIHFSEEVGPRKGSWKGGTVGHSIEMLPDELHEAAFRRYCAKEHKLRFVGAL